MYSLRLRVSAVNCICISRVLVKAGPKKEFQLIFNCNLVPPPRRGLGGGLFIHFHHIKNIRILGLFQFYEKIKRLTSINCN